VEGSFIPIVIKKDTIEYNANAFKTQPNATVEDLLKKLPGIEVEKDGTIKAQGEEVQNVLVDGKEFFEDDPKIATRNIPADVVDRVQVFDKASDLAAFTGIEDGNEEKTINLAIKEGKNRGWFGNIEASYGLENNYKSGALVNRFNDKMQLSLLGNVNNINEQAFTIEDYLRYSGQLEEVMETGQLEIDDIPIALLNPNGVNEVKMSGLNFNYDFSNKTSLRSNYYFNNSKNQTFNQRQNELLSGQNKFTQKANLENNSILNNHNVRLKLQHKFSPSSQLFVSSKLSSNASSLINEGNQQSSTDNILLNDAIQDTDSDIDLLNWSVNAKYQKKLKKLGRYFTSSFEAKRSTQNSRKDLRNQLLVYEAQGVLLDEILQQQLADRKNPAYELVLTYSEPIAKSNYLQFKSSYQSDAATKEKLFFDGTNSSSPYLLNQELSNTFIRDLKKITTGTVFKSIRSSYDWTIGIDHEYAQLSGGIAAQEQLNKGFNYLLPNSFFTYKFSGSKQLRINYQTRTVIPRIEQLQPVIDNSNPLSIIKGNPDLRPEYVHQFYFNYTSFNQFYLRSLFVGGNMSWTQHKIINLTSIDENLRTVLLPFNGESAFNATLFGNYDTPIKNKNFKFGLNENISFTQSPIAINDLEDTYSSFNLDQSLSIQNKKKEVLDWQFTYTLGWNQITYAQSKAFNRQFLSHSYLLDLNYYISDTWHLSTSLEQLQYPQIDFSQKQHFTFWDVSLTKSIQDEKFSFYLKADNLLDVRDRFERNAIGNQFLENFSNRIGRVVLLGVVYKLRKFGK
ncbi:MAG: outer membrane beta-barrel protein, partial [Bacteroidota bacterium]